jgi:hypothetical protein
MKKKRKVADEADGRWLLVLIEASDKATSGREFRLS